METAPSGVFTTTGTDCCGAEALPDPVSLVADTNVVESGAPAKEITDPATNPVPFTVSVKLPTGTGDGLTEEMLGSGRIVTDALPVDVGEAVLVARTVTVAGLGTADGAVY